MASIACGDEFLRRLSLPGPELFTSTAQLHQIYSQLILEQPSTSATSREEPATLQKFSRFLSWHFRDHQRQKDGQRGYMVVPLRRSQREVQSASTFPSRAYMLQYWENQPALPMLPIERRYVSATVGWGAFAKHNIVKYTIVCPYLGTLMTQPEVAARESLYVDSAKHPPATYKVKENWFMDPYSWKGATISTLENPGTWLNHSHEKKNCKTVGVYRGECVVGIVMISLRDIRRDEQLLQDYRDRTRGAPSWMFQ